MGNFVSSAYRDEEELLLFLVGILFVVHTVQHLWCMTPRQSVLCVVKMFGLPLEYMNLEVHELFGSHFWVTNWTDMVNL